jgi:hypothetical protein
VWHDVDVRISTDYRPLPGEETPRLVALSDGYYVTAPFRATISEIYDWSGTARLSIDIADGRPVVRDVTLYGDEAVAAWPPIALGKLAREALRRYVAERALRPIRDDDGNTLGLGRQSVTTRRARELVRQRRPHTVLDDDYLREVARVYQKAEPTGRPTAAVRERWGLNRDTAPKHVAQARARIDPATGKPFLPPVGPRSRRSPK